MRCSMSLLTKNNPICFYNLGCRIVARVSSASFSNDFTTYFVGELEKNFVEMGDAEVPFVVGQLRHHQLGKRGLSTVGKHVDVTRMMLLLYC